MTVGGMGRTMAATQPSLGTKLSPFATYPRDTFGTNRLTPIDEDHQLAAWNRNFQEMIDLPDNEPGKSQQFGLSLTNFVQQASVLDSNDCLGCEALQESDLFLRTGPRFPPIN